jgi:hypothetical protein
MGHLSNVLRDLGELAEARVMREQALAVKVAAWGADHPSVGRSIRNLGRVLHELGDLAEAQAALEQALAVLESALGPDHPNVGDTRWSLGAVLQDHGDLAGAKSQMTRAHAIFHAAFGPEHPTTRAVARWLAHAHPDELQPPQPVDYRWVGLGTARRRQPRLPSSMAAEVGDGLAAPFDLELLEDVMDVVLHGRDLDAEAAGNLLVRQALVQQLQHLQLASGEAADRRRGTMAGGQRRDPAEQGPGNPR